MSFLRSHLHQTPPVGGSSPAATPNTSLKTFAKRTRAAAYRFVPRFGVRGEPASVGEGVFYVRQHTLEGGSL